LGCGNGQYCADNGGYRRCERIPLSRGKRQISGQIECNSEAGDVIAQRAQADLVNYRNRASQELEEAQRTIKFGLLTRFLSVADDLSRAIDGVPDNADQNWSEGILLVLRNLENIFELEGVKKIEAKGIQFDPYRHEALLYDKTEEADEGEIITVIEEGYSINDRILRPSRVVVAQSPRVEQTANGELTTDQTTEQEGE